MNILELATIVFGGALLAGLVGSLTGLGGGIIITPLLTTLLGVDIHYAIGRRLGFGDRDIFWGGSGLREGASTVLVIQAFGRGWDRSSLPARPECCGSLVRNSD